MPEQRLTVILVASAATGGIRRHLSALAEQLAADGDYVHVLAPAITTSLLRPGGRLRIHNADVGARQPFEWLRARRLLARLASAGDVVHAHGLKAAVAAVCAAGPTPVLATWHNAPMTGASIARWPKLAAHGFLERRAAHGAARTLVVSPDLADRAMSAGAASVRLIEVPTPQPAPPAGDGERLRAELGLAPGRPIVLAIGRLQAQKRHDVLIAAAAPWSGRGDPQVLIAGTGPLRAVLQAQIEALGAPVRLLGERQDVPDLLALADVVVMASIWEGWPLVAAEALHAGVPLVASDLVGIRTMVGDAAILLPSTDPPSLRTALAELIEDAPTRRALSIAGRRQAAGWLSLPAANSLIRHDYLDVK